MPRPEPIGGFPQVRLRRHRHVRIREHAESRPQRRVNPCIEPRSSAPSSVHGATPAKPPPRRASRHCGIERLLAESRPIAKPRQPHPRLRQHLAIHTQSRPPRRRLRVPALRPPRRRCPPQIKHPSWPGPRHHLRRMSRDPFLISRNELPNAAVVRVDRNVQMPPNGMSRWPIRLHDSPKRFVPQRHKNRCLRTTLLAPAQAVLSPYRISAGLRRPKSDRLLEHRHPRHLHSGAVEAG